MCGRVRLHRKYRDIADKFALPETLPPINFPARWNGAPTQDFPVVRRNPETGARSLDLLRWGLIPSWAKDEKIGYSTFNARAEDLAGKPTYRGAWKAARRGILPLDGFYEWKKLGPKEKQPYLISRVDGELMAVATLWETKKLDGGETLRTFTIITTKANGFISQVHNRMPVILAMEDVPAWLGEDGVNLDDATAMMKRPAPEDWLTMVPVDKRMSNVKNWQEEFCRPIVD